MDLDENEKNQSNRVTETQLGAFENRNFAFKKLEALILCLKA